jgi:hypothetical protein
MLLNTRSHRFRRRLTDRGSLSRGWSLAALVWVAIIALDGAAGYTWIMDAPDVSCLVTCELP